MDGFTRSEGGEYGRVREGVRQIFFTTQPAGVEANGSKLSYPETRHVLATTRNRSSFGPSVLPTSDNFHSLLSRPPSPSAPPPPPRPLPLFLLLQQEYKEPPVLIPQNATTTAAPSSSSAATPPTTQRGSSSPPYSEPGTSPPSAIPPQNSTSF